MKYLFHKANSFACLKEAEISYGYLKNSFSRLDSTSTFVNRVPGYEKKRRYLKSYYSPYSGAFALKNSLYIPRPCAYSYNMTAITYFYGQNAMRYNLKNYNYD